MVGGNFLDFAVNFTASNLIVNTLADNKVVQTPANVLCTAIAHVRKITVLHGLWIPLAPNVNKTGLQQSSKVAALLIRKTSGLVSVCFGISQI